MLQYDSAAQAEMMKWKMLIDWIQVQARVWGSAEEYRGCLHCYTPSVQCFSLGAAEQLRPAGCYSGDSEKCISSYLFSVFGIICHSHVCNLQMWSHACAALPPQDEKLQRLLKEFGSNSWSSVSHHFRVSSFQSSVRRKHNII